MKDTKVIPAFLDDALGFNLDRVANLVRLELMRALARYELTPEQWQIMVLVWRSETPLRQQDITEMLVKDKHNVSRMVRRLEEKGWLKRQPDPNSRAFFLRPTALGQSLKDEVPRALYAHVAKIGLGLTPTQERELVALLKIVRGHLHKDGAEVEEADISL